MFQILIGNKKGFIFLEILIAIAFISIVFIVLLSIGFSSLSISSSIRKETQADSLMKEEIEALRSFRDGTIWATNGLGAVNFTDSNDSNPYFLFLDSGDSNVKWNLHSGKEITGIFTRYVVFDKVSRDSATHYIQNIYNPSNNDPDTVKVKITVLWLDKISQVFEYLTNWQNK